MNIRYFYYLIISLCLTHCFLVVSVPRILFDVIENKVIHDIICVLIDMGGKT